MGSFIANHDGIPTQHQQLLVGGRPIHTLPNCQSDNLITIQVCLSLNGGKTKKKKKAKKGGKKKKGKKKAEVEEAKPDEFDFMNVDELSKIKKVLSDKLNGIEEERSYFQLERDFLQKIKHLEYDHSNTINSVAMEAEMIQNDEKNQHQVKKEKLIQNKQILAGELLKNKILNEDQIKTMEETYNARIKNVNQEFGDKLTKLDDKYQVILRDLRNDLNLQTKLQIHEIEERKNLHINDLIQNHEKSFDKMKDYYNSITRDNLDLIRSLKTELAELKSKIQSHEDKYAMILGENKKLNLPLNEAKSEVEVYNKKLVNYNKDKRSLKSNQKHLLMLTNKLNIVKKANQALKAQYP